MNNKKGFFAVISREIGLIWSRKSFFIGMICLPIVCLVFFLTLFGNGEMKPLPFAVVDLDNSSLSHEFILMLKATAGVEVKYMTQSVNEAEDLMKKDKIGAILIIPKNMENDIYSATVVKPQLYINSLRLLNSSLVYKDIAVTAQMFSSGIEIQMLVTSGKTMLESYNLALPIYYEEHLLFNPYASYGYYLTSPFNFLMIILFSVLFFLFSLGLERKTNRAEEWLRIAGESPYVALLGKMIPYSVFYSLFAILSNLIIFGFMGTPLQGSIWLMTLNCIVCIISYQAVGLLIYFITRKLMVAMSISAALSTMSFTMSGLTFPLMAMYEPVQILAHLFPYTYYMSAYVDITRGANYLYALSDIAIMSIYPVLTILVYPFIVKLILRPLRKKNELI